MRAPNSTSVRNETDLIAAFGGSREMSEALEMLQSRVSNWTSIGIPPNSFKEIVDAAKRLGISGITYDLLFEMRERRQQGMRDIAKRNELLRSA